MDSFQEKYNALVIKYNALLAENEELKSILSQHGIVYSSIKRADESTAFSSITYPPIKLSLDEKIAIIKHALNVTNSNEKVRVGDAEMSIDTILIKMAQLNKRKSVLDQMRKQLPKAREEQRSYMSRNTVPEYRYINYDLELIKKEYETVSKTIMEMQMALDKYNQTVQFEVDI